ncbi:hypothetical protein D9M71_839950 [compost metagenome]
MDSVLQRIGDALQGQRVIKVEEQRFGFGIDLDERITGQTMIGSPGAPLQSVFELVDRAFRRWHVISGK